MVEIVSNPRVMEHVGMKRKVENGGKRGKGQRYLITVSDRRRKSKRERERGIATDGLSVMEMHQGKTGGLKQTHRRVVERGRERERERERERGGGGC